MSAVTFCNESALDDYVREAVILALRSAADDFQRLWPVYGDDWLRERATKIESGSTPVGERPVPLHSCLACEGDDSYAGGVE